MEEKKFISLEEILKILGISRSSLERLIKNKDERFPKCRKISARKNLWSLLEVNDWIESRGSA